MLHNKISEEFVKRANVHQTHFESLVLLGKGGLEELNDKIEKFLSTRSGKDVGLNTTIKIDGCLSEDTLIPTTVGDIPISQITADWPEVKYLGWGYDEKTKTKKKVLLNFPRYITEEHDYYKLSFENGSEVKATENHPFRIAGDEPTYKKVEELNVGDEIKDD